MQIKVEIEVKPEELRRFLGLPDVSGLQDDVLNFVRETMGKATDGLTPAADFVRGTVGKATENLSPAADFVRENIDSIKGTSAATLAKLISSVKLRLMDSDEPAQQASATPVAAQKRVRKASASSAAARRRRTKK